MTKQSGEFEVENIEEEDIEAENTEKLKEIRVISFYEERVSTYSRPHQNTFNDFADIVMYTTMCIQNSRHNLATLTEFSDKTVTCGLPVIKGNTRIFTPE